MLTELSANIQRTIGATISLLMSVTHCLILCILTICKVVTASQVLQLCHCQINNKSASYYLIRLLNRFLATRKKSKVAYYYTCCGHLRHLIKKSIYRRLPKKLKAIRPSKKHSHWSYTKPNEPSKETQDSRYTQKTAPSAAHPLDTKEGCGSSPLKRRPLNYLQVEST